ncbi:hypothetical protein SAMN05444817_11163 [Corynebacterium appendicis CIP 107643]|uniref:Uncharacterized protein n=1 Tax=Corynebacterium appendicis CIP 107643 TaxID=1161099 RepID=A0A1N7JVI7_9CORY|nr:hypothetical protein CAPP_03895 [Corynebacterium appendicis CIP 107643]SIS53327.1 hypothetical protein SAMN05444817_11163 [Corynebacterium appendicis CIP 107643]
MTAPATCFASPALPGEAPPLIETDKDSAVTTRISRKVAALAVAATTALVVTACTPPNQNDSDQKVDTATSQNPDSLPSAGQSTATGTATVTEVATETSTVDAGAVDPADADAAATDAAETAVVEPGETAAVAPVQP